MTTKLKTIAKPTYDAITHEAWRAFRVRIERILKERSGIAWHMRQIRDGMARITAPIDRQIIGGMIEVDRVILGNLMGMGGQCSVNGFEFPVHFRETREETESRATGKPAGPWAWNRDTWTGKVRVYRMADR